MAQAQNNIISNQSNTKKTKSNKKSSNSKRKSKSNNYTTKKWSFNEIGFEFDKYYIQLRYHGVKKEIYFLSNVTNEPSNDLDTILERFSIGDDDNTASSTVFLEWCDLSSGKYYYFNLYTLFNHFQKPVICLLFQQQPPLLTE